MNFPVAKENDCPDNLSQIETKWSLLYRAHRGPGEMACSAQHELVERYAGAVYCYLLRVTGNADVASELTQEFALRFLRGDFHRADPGRGLFRNYVKGAVLNLLTDMRRKHTARPVPLPGDGDALADPSQGAPGLDFDREFLECLRDEILRRAWDRLARQQDEGGPPFFTVLRFRADHPALPSHEIAERLSPILGKALSAVWVRQNLRRARERFVEFVEVEVSRSLACPTPEERDEEMRTLGLWAYCRQERG